jgi:hypothetical protein
MATAVYEAVKGTGVSMPANADRSPGVTARKDEAPPHRPARILSWHQRRSFGPVRQVAGDGPDAA